MKQIEELKAAGKETRRRAGGSLPGMRRPLRAGHGQQDRQHDPEVDPKEERLVFRERHGRRDRPDADEVGTQEARELRG